MTRKPLPIPRDHWHSRWLVLPTWRRLHRVARLAVPLDAFEESPVAHGQTLCGVFGKLAMPGILSRDGLQRCAHCCDRAGVPRGDGAPFNQGVDA